MSQERRTNNVEYSQNVARFQHRLVIPARQTRMFLTSLECTVSPASSGPINQGRGDRLGSCLCLLPARCGTDVGFTCNHKIRTGQLTPKLVWHIGDATSYSSWERWSYFPSARSPGQLCGQRRARRCRPKRCVVCVCSPNVGVSYDKPD
jgi:hypothetical protein